MRMKKMLSALCALAMSASVFAGLAANASAATADATVSMTYVNYNAADTAYGTIAAGDTAMAGYNKISGGSVGFAHTGWGVNYITYLQVDASKIDGTITGATLSLDISGSTDSKREGVVGVGYNQSVWSDALTYNTADKTITTVGATATTTTKSASTFETKTFDITNALKNDDDKIVTILVYATNAAGAYIKNPAVSVEYAEAGSTVYNVSFKETNGIAGTVTIDDADVTDGTTLAAGNYSYVARTAQSGYKPVYGTFTVSDENADEYNAVVVNYTFEKMRDIAYTGLDMITPYADTVYNAKDVSITKSQIAGETIVYEFDIYVPDGNSASIAYYSGGNLGTTYIFDAASTAGRTVVKYQTSSAGAYEINQSEAYNSYVTGAWAHVKIETAVVDGGLGNSLVYVTHIDNADAFTANGKVRVLSNNVGSGDRAIGPRNLSGKVLNKISFSGNATIMNDCMYTKASNVTVKAENAVVSGIESGLIADNTYIVTVAPADGYSLQAVSVDGEELTANEDGSYTVVIAGDTTIDVTVAAPAAKLTAEVGEAQYFTGDGEGDYAAAYVTTISNIGNAGADLASVVYTINSTDYTWNVNDAVITIAAGGSAKVGLVVEGLTQAEQAITVSASANAQ